MLLIQCIIHVCLLMSQSDIYLVGLCWQPDVSPSVEKTSFEAKVITLQAYAPSQRLKYHWSRRCWVMTAKRQCFFSEMGSARQKRQIIHVLARQNEQKSFFFFFKRGRVSNARKRGFKVCQYEGCPFYFYVRGVSILLLR